MPYPLEALTMFFSIMESSPAEIPAPENAPVTVLLRTIAFF